MDSLGGILIKGLLGNPILAKFNLFLEFTLEDITPTPTPTATPTPTVTPTVTLPSHGGGNGAVETRKEKEEERKRVVKITVRYKNKEYSSVYTLTDKILRVTINTIDYLNTVKEHIHNISLKFKKKGDTTVKVKIHDD